MAVSSSPGEVLDKILLALEFILGQDIKETDRIEDKVEEEK